MTDEERSLLEEYARRDSRKKAHRGIKQKILSECFKQQIEFILDPSREKAALCTRRAGKTEMWPRYALLTMLDNPRSIIRVWGVTRLRAKQLVWEQLKDCAARHRLKNQPNETELTMRFENGCEVRLLGADKDKDVQKKRGDKTVLEIVLEAGVYGPYLKTLVEDVVEPCLFDLQGTICLEGTPGPVCAGFWYEVSGRNDFGSKWVSSGGEEGIGSGWSCHRWSVLDNPFLPHAREELNAQIRKHRWTDKSATYLREWCARWVNDLQTLFYHYNPAKNLYDPKQIQPWGEGWQHVLGWDLGFKDDMALVCWGWHPQYKDLFEVASWKQPGVVSQVVIDKIKEWQDSFKLNLIAMVADTGGGGKMYVEDIQNRYGIVFEPAKKTEKYEHVRLFNDDLEGSFVRLRPGSPYVEELCVLQKDPDNPPDKTPREDPKFPNHCCDAGLYGWRRAWHFLHQEEEKKPAYGTADWFKQQEDEIERKLLDSVKKDQAGDNDWNLYPGYEMPEDPR